MAEKLTDKLGLDNEVHELKLGSSFSKGPVAYHSIRYDFKPASVDTTQMANVDIGEGNSVTVTVPHVEGSGTSHTVYKGNKRPCQKECVLIIDHQTGEITLEKLATNIQLKKTSQVTQGEGKRSVSPGHAKKHHKSLHSNFADSLVENQNNKRGVPHGQNRSRSLHPVRLDKRKFVNKPSWDNIVAFTKSINGDVAAFLKTHKMDKTRRPHVCSVMSLQTFQQKHPEFYLKSKKRLRLKEKDFDSLNTYLCDRFSEFLADSQNVYGCVQRLEDVIDFILEKYSVFERNN